MRFLEKLKERYGVGLWGVIAILVSFTLAGMTVVRVRAPILGLILPDNSPKWAYWVAYPLIIFPTYQISLLAYGAVLGQFSFFWKREKAVGRWLARKIGRRTAG